MAISRRQLFFYLFFLASYLACILLGETPLGIVIWAAMASILLINPFKLTSFFHSKSQQTHLLAIALFGGFFVTTFLSVFFTQNSLVTLNKWVMICLSWLIFVYFSLISEEELPVKLFLYGVLLIGINVGLLSCLFFFWPNLALYLPGMNLIFSSYGHNHSAILYVFCLPIAWMLAREFRFKWLSLLPLIFLMGSLILTFARADILLAVIEIVLLGSTQFSPKIRHRLFSSKKILGIILLFGAVAILGLVFWRGKSGEICFPTASNRTTCKSLQSEYRLQYWHQAMSGIKERPLVGWGGGTFAFLSSQKATFPYYYAAYAHNEYLQLLSEYGVLLSLPFFVLLMYVVWVAVVNRNKFNLNQAETYLLIGLVSLFVNAIFDYDWNFSAIWLLLLMSMALFLRSAPRVPEQLKSASKFFSQKIFRVILKVSLGLSFAVLLIWLVGYLWSSWLWYAGQPEASVKAFPFIYPRAETQAAKTTDPSWYEHVYQNDFSILNPLTNNPHLTLNQRTTLLQKMIILNPFNFAYQEELLKIAQTAQQPELYLITLENIRLTYAGKRLSLLSLEVKRRLFDETMVEINTLTQTNLELATKIYQSLANFDNGLAAVRPFGPFQNPTTVNPTQLKASLDTLADRSFLPDYSDSLTPWLLNQMQLELQRGAWLPALLDVRRLLLINHGSNWQTWEVFSVNVQNLLVSQQSSNQTNLAWETLESWFQAWQLLKGQAQDHGIDFDQEQLLAKNLVSVGNAYYLNGQMKQALQMYSQATQVIPYIEQISPFAFQASNADLKMFDKFILTVAPIDNWTYQFPFLENSAFKKPLQVLANQYIHDQNWGRAEQILLLLTTNHRHDYFASAQLGNYYLMRHQPDSARKAFESCLSGFTNPQQETDCYWGNQDLNSYTEASIDQQQRYWHSSLQLLTN